MFKKLERMISRKLVWHTLCINILKYFVKHILVIRKYSLIQIYKNMRQLYNFYKMIINDRKHDIFKNA